VNDVSQPDVPAQVVAFAQILWELTVARDFTGAVRELGDLLTGLTGSQWQPADSDVFAELGRIVSALRESIGHDHIVTLLARHLLAERPQDAAPALVEWLQLSEDESRMLGADSAATLTAFERVAQKRSETGDYAGAIALGQDVLNGRRQVLGDSHVHTFGIRLSLAQWRGEGFDQAAAVSELEPLVEELREKLGEDHAHTLIARHTLALWAPEPDDVQEAVALWEQLVEAEARVLGEDYSATILAGQELQKWRARAEEYRFVAEQIYKDEGLFGFDDVAEDEKAEAAEAARAVGEDSEAQAWAAAQSRAFPQWAAQCGGAEIWDFSTKSFEAIAQVVFREMPTIEHLDDPANAALTEGLTWYLGEILCRLEPGQWQWVCCEDHDSSLADRYRVARTGSCEWPIMPRRKLNYLIESGNPLDLSTMTITSSIPNRGPGDISTTPTPALGPGRGRAGRASWSSG